MKNNSENSLMTSVFNMNQANGSTVVEQTLKVDPKDICFSLILFVGMVGNALVALVICCERRLRTTYYLLVLHLALCDLVVTIVCNLRIRFSVVNLFAGRDINVMSNKALCLLHDTAIEWLYTAAICFMSLIALLRYQTVARPFDETISRNKLKVIILAVYVSTCTVYIPSCVAMQATRGDCTDSWLGNAIYDSYLVTVYIVRFYPPMLIIAILYGRMCYLLLLHEKVLVHITTQDGRLRQRFSRKEDLSKIRRPRNIKTLVISVICVAFFVTTNFPVNLTRLLDFLGVRSVRLNVHYYWMGPLYFFGACVVNPIVYGFADKTLRTSCKRTLRKCFFSCRRTLSKCRGFCNCRVIRGSSQVSPVVRDGSA